MSINARAAEPVGLPKEKTAAASSPVATESSSAPACVVGLGASAGGLEALQTFFAHMPADSGLAFVVVQHLSPDYKSLMVELLSKTTSMPVKRIEDGMKLEPNCVYLIPPKKNVTLFHHQLLLTDQDHGRGLNLPIDLFFRSLAEDLGERAVAIVLSGTGSDGTRGIRAIKEEGGLAMAQDPATAKFDGMPSSVIATGLADYVLPPENMPAELIKFVKHPFLARSVPVGETLGAQEDALTKITALLRKATGVDFTFYKPTTVVRRIERRMGIAQLQTMADYLSYLHQSPNEVTALYKDLLIGVTKFFRDTEAFEVMEKKIIPALFERKRLDPVIRLWTAGCATGEEAYSMAILLREQMMRSDKPYDVKVFATDLDRGAIETASSGLYPASIAAEVSEERLKRFFVDKGGAYQVAREIREMVVFAPHNLLKDPPFTKIDLVSCRNMLIYLQPVLQQRVLSLFSFSLSEGGILFLGGSETAGELAPLFEVVDAKWKIFERRRGMAAPLDAAISLAPSRERLLRSHFTPTVELRRSPEDTLIADVQNRLIAQYGPICLMMDETGELLHSFGRMPDYLRMPGGRASLNVIKMLPKELGLALSTALHRCIKERTEVVYNNIRVGPVADGRVTNLRLEPLPAGSSQQMRMLLYLEELRIAPTSADVDLKNYDPQSDQSQRINDLEHELQMTRENLQATVEELETSNEELQATNEELLASNEELQSTNEELQSVNEELYTVNAEYQSKIAELTELNTDIENLLASSQVGTIFLDADLRIRKFTNAISREINLLPHDVGRPVMDLGHPVLKGISDAIPLALKGTGSDRVVEVAPGRWLLARILPYDSHSSRIQGVVITLINITDLKRAQAALDDSAHYSQGVIDALSYHICVLDEKGVIRSVNQAWKNFMLTNPPVPANAGIGDNYLTVCDSAKGPDSAEASAMASGIRAVIAGKRVSFVLEYPCHAPDQKRWYVARVNRLSGASGALAVVSHEESTDRPRMKNTP